MNRTRAFAAVLFLLDAMVPLAASAQNLEAGKTPGQLFSNNCAECHRSPRGLLRTVPPGSLPGFLREHYTTSKDMAQQLAGFLTANGAADTRGRPPEVRQPPQASELPQVRQQRPAEADQTRPQRPIESQQQQAARPPESPPAQAARPEPERKLSRRERRAKRDAEQAARAAAIQTPVAERDARGNDKNRRGRISPARIEAASERGKEALPLGDVVKSEPAVPAPEAAAPAPAAPATTAAPAEAATRPDPVPQVSPAPTPSAPTPPTAPSTAEIPRARPAPDTQQGSDDPPSGSTAPAAAAPATAPSASSSTTASPGGGPPAPPISN